jgi:hypothetical protein
MLNRIMVPTDLTCKTCGKEVEPSAKQCPSCVSLIKIHNKKGIIGILCGLVFIGLPVLYLIVLLLLGEILRDDSALYAADIFFFTVFVLAQLLTFTFSFLGYHNSKKNPNLTKWEYILGFFLGVFNLLIYGPIIYLIVAILHV